MLAINLDWIVHSHLSRANLLKKKGKASLTKFQNKQKEKVKMKRLQILKNKSKMQILIFWFNISLC